jgi:hypothetical protein
MQANVDISNAFPNFGFRLNDISVIGQFITGAVHRSLSIMSWAGQTTSSPLRGRRHRLQALWWLDFLSSSSGGSLDTHCEMPVSD